MRKENTNLEPMECLKPNSARQREIFEKYQEDLIRKNRNKRRKAIMLRRRRATTAVCASLVLIFGIVATKKISTEIKAHSFKKAYALENNGEVTSYQYMIDKEIDEEDYQDLLGLGFSEEEINRMREEEARRLGTRKGNDYTQSSQLPKLGYTKSKYGVLTPESVELVKATGTLNVNGINKKIKVKNAGVLKSTIGEKLTLKCDQDGNTILNLNLRVPTNVTAEQIDKALEDTELRGLGRSFKMAEEEYGVNALFLVGLSCLESNYGQSNFAQNRNNITGFMAYTEDPSKAKVFGSKDDCIFQTAAYLDKHYLSKGGKHFNGPTPMGLNEKYCTSSLWAAKINNIVLNLHNSFLEK